MNQNGATYSGTAQAQESHEAGCGMGSPLGIMVGFTMAFVAIFAFGFSCGWLMRRPVPPNAAPDDRLWKSWGTQVVLPTLILAALAALWLWLRYQGWFSQARE
jgi:hypothetical protein